MIPSRACELKTLGAERNIPLSKTTWDDVARRNGQTPGSEASVSTVLLPSGSPGTRAAIRHRSWVGPGIVANELSHDRMTGSPR